MNAWLRRAIICGAAPLLIGISIFLLWLVTRWDWLMMAGLFTIWFGVASVAVGLISLGIFAWVNLRQTRRLATPVIWAILAALTLLLVNFPVAVAIVIGGVTRMTTQYVVRVVNQSSMRITGLRVSGGGITASFDQLAPGAEQRRVFWIKHDGTLKLSGLVGDRPVDAVLDGYVTHNAGGSRIVYVRSDGALDIEQVTR